MTFIEKFCLYYKMELKDFYLKSKTNDKQVLLYYFGKTFHEFRENHIILSKIKNDLQELKINFRKDGAEFYSNKQKIIESLDLITKIIKSLKTSNEIDLLDKPTKYINILEDNSKEINITERIYKPKSYKIYKN